LASGLLASPAPARHPLDPDVVPSSKATAVFVLGVIAVITGPLVGGVVPAVVALVLSQQAAAEIAVGRGYLTGLSRVRAGRTLAWIGILLAAAAIVTAIVIGILGLAGGAGRDFPSTSD
jgi:hypothetical protein